MSTGKMHADEVDIDASLVRRLLETQFPHWAGLPIEPVASSGTDNAMYRVGDDMAVRLPRILSATGQIDKEWRWLPRLAPHLPLAIPAPLALGSPGESYPWQWSVYRWLEGAPATIERLGDTTQQAAIDLARFIAALQRIDATDGPAPDDHNAYRGLPLATRDEDTRAAIASLDGMVDVDAATAAWDAALDAPEWNHPPAWIHGDLQSGNLLAHQGRLSAVIDFGCLGVGDPACDLMVAWNLFSPTDRAAFRAELAVDDATWARGRGWALSVGLIALPYYQHTNPTLADISRRTIAAVLSDATRA